MASFLDEFRDLSALKDYSHSEVVKPAVDVSKYEGLLASKEKFLMSFVRANYDGTLVAKDGDVTIIMPESELYSTAAQRQEKKERLLNVDIQVVVYEIKDGVVFVSHTRSLDQVDVINRRIYRAYKDDMAAHKDEYARILKEVTEKVELEAGGEYRMTKSTHDNRIRTEYLMALAKYKAEHNIRRLILPARICAVTKGQVVLDILNAGVVGTVTAANWSTAYTPNLNLVAQEGDIIDVEIYGQNVRDKKPVFGEWRCARCTCISDPWDSMEQRFHKDDMVTVKCMQINQRGVGLGMYLGSVVGEEDILVHCEFPTKRYSLDTKFPIVVGEQYNCKVYVVNSERRLLRARTIAIAGMQADGRPRGKMKKAETAETTEES